MGRELTDDFDYGSWHDPTTPDSFDVVSFSTDAHNAQIGCLVRYLADLHKQEQRLYSQLQDVQRSMKTAIDAIDRFIEDAPQP